MSDARPTHCPRCGQKVSPTVGECFFCDPDPDGVGAAAVEAEHSFGLLLFEAEELLARGHGDRALVAASRAVKERPDNLTALAIYERARRDVLKGRRREKLEARIAEGRALFEAGRFDEAERIVRAALKLLPEHLLAQQLLAMLKERRLAAGTVEAEVERELDTLARARAARAAAAARAALASGWHRRALVEARRGLRLRPDDPELLAVLHEIQRSNEAIERQAARRRAVLNRVRAAQDLLARGRLEQSLAILRAVLREEPDDERAQAAVQEVRRALRRRQGEPAPAPAAGTGPEPGRVPAAIAPAPSWPEPGHGAVPVTTPPASVRVAPVGPAPPRPPVPGEILLPRTRRRATPIALVLAGAGAVIGLFYFLVVREGAAPPPPVPPPVTAPMAAARERAPGPLDGVAPELRAAIEATLAEYARALESRDPGLLARARPDLPEQERAALLSRFEGAINVATDLRVLDVVGGEGQVSVPVLRTDVIVGGSAAETSPVEEMLRFVRHDEGWALDAERR